LKNSRQIYQKGQSDPDYQRSDKLNSSGDNFS